MTMFGDSREAHMHSIWREVLGGVELQLDENFFDAGGTSLLAIRLAARLRANISQSITVQDIFRFPTVRTLSHHIFLAGTSDGAASSSPRALRQRSAYDQLRSNQVSRRRDPQI